MEIVLPLLRVKRPIVFRIKARKESGSIPIVYGAEVCPDFKNAFTLLVAQIRHIQALREVERHLRKKEITMEQAVRSWFHHHQPIEPPAVCRTKKRLFS